jgi:hypothetical protein
MEMLVSKQLFTFFKGAVQLGQCLFVLAFVKLLVVLFTTFDISMLHGAQ